MTADQIVASLRAKSPGALAELLDSYGNQLFQYCWFMLQSRDIAQIALRDTLVVAEANIARLAESELLGTWLYALARVECLRRSAEPHLAEDTWPSGELSVAVEPSVAVEASVAVEPSVGGEPWLAGEPGQGDAEARLVAWRAATSIAADEFEVLELTCRHEVDLGLVLGLPAVDAQVLLDRGKQNLERALGAEILATRGRQACSDLAKAMSSWTGTMTPQIRASVLEHAGGCEICDSNLPRNVSVWRVFAWLPAPALSPLARSEVLGFFDDDHLSANREFAVDRPAPLEASGFPAEAEPPAAVPIPDGPRSSQRLRFLRPGPGGVLARRGALAVAAALAAAAIAIAIALVGSGGKPAGSSGKAVAVGSITPSQAAGALPGSVPQGPGQIRSTQPVPTGTAGGQAVINEATKPAVPAPKPGVPMFLWPAPAAAAASAGTLTVSPGRLSLRTGSTAPITLTAVGGPVIWSAMAPTTQVSLSSAEGTLQAGQTVSLEIAVGPNRVAGSAAVSIEPPYSAPLTVEVSWTLPASSSPSLSHYPSPDPSQSPAPSQSLSPSPAQSPSPAPSSSASRSPSPSPSRSSSRSHPDPRPRPRPRPRPHHRLRPRPGGFPTHRHRGGPRR